MININNVYIQYGNRIVLDKLSLTIGEKDKVGLVGLNGAGKSTLLSAIDARFSRCHFSGQLLSFSSNQAKTMASSPATRSSR